MPRTADLEQIAVARVFIRSIAAFVLYLRFGEASNGMSVDDAYGKADQFIGKLVDDLKAESEVE
jgi:hypothetical protein